jgi:hypothetical protein
MILKLNIVIFNHLFLKLLKKSQNLRKILELHLY